MLEKAYQSMEDSRIQPEKLRNLIRSILEGRETKAEGAKLFKEHAAKVFPTRWRPAVPKRTLGKKLRSNKQDGLCTQAFRSFTNCVRRMLQRQS